MKRHILVADDNKVDIQKVVLILEGDGLIPIVAHDSSLALEYSDLYRLDLAILDIHMPNMSGFNLTKEIRNRAATKNLPIILMSGTYKAKEDVKMALQAGADDFVLKPLDSLVLSAKVASLLTKQMPWAEWKLEGSKSESRGQLEVDIQVLSISEMGIRILSSVPLATKTSPVLKISILEELEIPAPHLQVLECQRIPAGYSSYLTFVGMSENNLKKIRLYCRELSTKAYDLSRN